MFVNLPDKPMPLDYQKADRRFVFRGLMAGESCSLIGIGSVGKSNLMQHLTLPDVQAHHLETPDAPYLLTVYLDPHTLVHLDGAALEQAGSSWSGYELMLSRLYRTLRYRENISSRQRRGLSMSVGRGVEDEALAERVAPFLNRIQRGDPVERQSGLRHLEEAVYTVLADDDRWRVAFLLDEIDDFDALPPRFFQSLRGLRDQYKGRVAYVTTGKRPLDVLLTSLSDVERSAMREFTELFRDHTRYISPLDEVSAAAVVDRFIARYEDEYEIHLKGEAFLKGEVYKLTGGHVGLLRRSFRPAVQYLIDEEPGRLSDYLLENPSVSRECESIIASLTEDERRVFYHAIHDREIKDLRVWRGLFEKHIVTETARGGADFRLPLLGDYAHRNPDALVGRANRR